VFENRVLRRVFGPRGYEFTGECRELHNEELHNLYCSPSIIRMIEVKDDEMGWTISRHRERRNTCKIFVERPEGRRPLGR
jgi:hypothetical protein